MKYQKGFTVFELFAASLFFAIAGGWIANIIKLVGSIGDSTVATTMFIARIVGVPFFPLGAVLGYL